MTLRLENLEYGVSVMVDRSSKYKDTEKEYGKKIDYKKKQLVIEKEHEYGTKFYNLGNDFMNALDYAFQNHLDFEISPDNIWQIIMSGISEHINEDPDQYRTLLGINHDDKKKIEVRNDDLLSDPSQWKTIFPLFESKILEDLNPKGIASSLILNFTNSTPINKIIKTISFMNMLENFYLYSVSSMCGIPNIILTGEVQDWQSILDRVQSLPKELNLEYWTELIIPHLKRFVKARENPEEIDKDHWKSIYKYMSGLSSGQDCNVSGWIIDFFPKCHKVKEIVNWQKFGSGHLAVPFEWTRIFDVLKMEFVAGFVQHKVENNRVIPQVGWAVYRKNE
uniref:DUF4419 domain-containing protein n=1 Tax=viral metagenome TaxID=1070528 RepID=A0A6C0JQH6_9ZZZZ